MTVPATAPQNYTSPELSGTGDSLCGWVATTLLEEGLVADGLYVATSDGGAREALAFWEAARQTGFAFASPAAFPWTLANSATGRISQVLGIHGPCTTYIGGDEALAEAEADAADDLAEGLISSALVVSVRGDSPILPSGGPVRIRLTARLLMPPGVS